MRPKTVGYVVVWKNRVMHWSGADAMLCVGQIGTVYPTRGAARDALAFSVAAWRRLDAAGDGTDWRVVRLVEPSGGPRR